MVNKLNMKNYEIKQTKKLNMVQIKVNSLIDFVSFLIIVVEKVVQKHIKHKQKTSLFILYNYFYTALTHTGGVNRHIGNFTQQPFKSLFDP